MDAPIVNGMAVSRVYDVPWELLDDGGLQPGLGRWKVMGRARVEWPGGGLANGLALERDLAGFVDRVVVVWERPRDGGAGRFRLVPYGSW